MSDLIRVEGISEAISALRRLYTKAEHSVGIAVGEAATVVRDIEREHAPKQSGKGAASIKVEGPRRAGSFEHVASVGPRDNPYMARVARGMHGDDSLGRHFDVEGTDYVAPARSAADAVAEEAVVRQLRSALR